MKWRGIPIDVLADVNWRTREQLLDILETECAAAAERQRAVLLARALRVEPDAPEVIEARIRDNGWNVEELRREYDRNRHAATRAEARSARQAVA